MNCTQCNDKEPMTNSELCTTCSSNNYFREFSFTEELPELDYCNACHKLAHKDNELCPEFAHTCNLCSNEIINNEGLEMNPWGATCKACLIDLGISITCDLCGVRTNDYSNGGFWNCLCETCWNKQKDRI